MSRRLKHELATSHEQQNDFMIDYDDEDISKLHVVIKAPHDSLYRYKFVRLSLEIPSNYPFVPPIANYFNYAGINRTHPNLYNNGGKVCLSILGTWAGEPWVPIMNLNILFRTIQSLLDYTPYVHEPGKKDHKDYNLFVQYVTWKDMCMDYIQYETRPRLKEYMIQCLRDNEKDIRSEIETFPEKKTVLASLPYSWRSFNSNLIQLDWNELKETISQFLNKHCNNDVLM